MQSSSPAPMKLDAGAPTIKKRPSPSLSAPTPARKFATTAVGPIQPLLSISALPVVRLPVGAVVAALAVVLAGEAEILRFTVPAPDDEGSVAPALAFVVVPEVHGSALHRLQEPGPRGALMPVGLEDGQGAALLPPVPALELPEPAEALHEAPGPVLFSVDPP